MTEEQKSHKEHEETKRYEISNLCILSDLCVFVVNTENSENPLNPIIIRIRKQWGNENAPLMSFPHKRESRKIIIKEWIPASAGMTFCVIQ